MNLSRLFNQISKNFIQDNYLDIIQIFVQIILNTELNTHYVKIEIHSHRTYYVYLIFQRGYYDFFIFVPYFFQYLYFEKYNVVIKWFAFLCTYRHQRKKPFSKQKMQFSRRLLLVKCNAVKFMNILLPAAITVFNEKNLPRQWFFHFQTFYSDVCRCMLYAHKIFDSLMHAHLLVIGQTHG